MDRSSSLNEKQTEAVHQTEGPVLILAGAGSGKTRVLTHRISYLIKEKQVNPWNILAITFTNKAAGEMRDRVDQIVGFGAESVWVSTFHSMCVRFLRRFIDRLGYENHFTIYDSDDQKSVIKDVCKMLQLDPKVYKDRSLLAVISSAKDKLISPETYEQQVAGNIRQKKVAQVYREYQAQLKKNNALDFDDLIVKTVELFQSCPDVLEYYQERFRYLMVDEYQDTNIAQFHLIRLLAEKYRNLCVVGDDDQSIYKFRGADIRNILGFEEVFPDAAVIRLEQNYRSTQNILNSANVVICNNTGRKSKTLWTKNEKGEPVHFRKFLNGFEEAEYITGNISKKVQKEGYHYSDCAVLYRTNAQSRLFEEKMLMANIPYKLVGGVNFYARKEIKDLLSYLKTVNNAQDDLAVRRIINVPKRGIGATTIGRVQNYATEQGISFYEALKVAEEIPGLGKSAAKIQPFVTFIQTLRSQTDYLTVTQLLEEIIEQTGYVKELEAEDTDEARGRIENIDELISKAVTYDEGTKTPQLSEFLEEVSLVADIDTVDDNQDRVLLMTLHSAKGLEFPLVYLAGMEDGMFPSAMAFLSDDPGDLEEERRLCYVGITRAMKELTLTSAQQRMIRGETRYNKISRFVQEIPRELLDMGEVRPKETLKRPAATDNYSQIRRDFQAKVFQQTQTQFQVKSAQPLDYQEGDRVSHQKFGIGIVLSIVSGGKDYEVTVDFEKVGVKKMFASFAKLKKI